MKFNKTTLGILLGALLLAGCETMRPAKTTAPPDKTPTPEERAAMQTQTFPAREGVVFAATIAVLQDLEWKLDKVDRAAGLIQASNPRRLEPLGPREETSTNFEWRRAAIKRRTSEKSQWTRWDSMVIHLEKWPQRQTRCRAILSRNGTLPAMSYPAKVNKQDVIINAPAKEESVDLLLPEVYESFFKRLEAAVLDRTGVDKE